MFKWFGKVNFSPYAKVANFARHFKDGYLMTFRCRQCVAIPLFHHGLTAVNT